MAKSKKIVFFVFVLTLQSSEVALDCLALSTNASRQTSQRNELNNSDAPTRSSLLCFEESGVRLEEGEELRKISKTPHVIINGRPLSR